MFENSDIVIANFGAHYSSEKFFKNMMERVLGFFAGGGKNSRLFLYRTSGTAHPHCCRENGDDLTLRAASSQCTRKGEPVPYSVPIDRVSSMNASRVLEMGAGSDFLESTFVKHYHWEFPYKFNELAGEMLKKALPSSEGALVDVSEMSTQRPDLHRPNQWGDCLHYPLLGGMNWWWIAMVVNVLEGMESRWPH